MTNIVIDRQFDTTAIPTIQQFQHNPPAANSDTKDCVVTYTPTIPSELTASLTFADTTGVFTMNSIDSPSATQIGTHVVRLTPVTPATTTSLDDTKDYVVFEDELRTWADARTKCRAWGGELMSITTTAEYDTLKGMINNPATNYWTVGLADGSVSSWDDGASTFDADLQSLFIDTGFDNSAESESVGSCKAVQVTAIGDMVIWNQECETTGYTACKMSYFLEFEILVQEPCEDP